MKFRTFFTEIVLIPKSEILVREREWYESSASSGVADWSRSKGVFKSSWNWQQTHVMELLEVKRGFFVLGKVSRYIIYQTLKQYRFCYVFNFC